MNPEAPESAAGIADAVTRGDLKVTEIVERSLERIRRQDGEIHAFLDVDAESALERARALDRAVASGDRLGALAGVPVAVKDNIHVAGRPTTCASRVLGGYRSPINAHAVDRLLSAGAVVVGKTNLDEFAMGSTTEYSAFGPTLNPLDPKRVPGGSSGGSAAAVAARFVPVALGSDTGGSIRQPAAWCGVVGFKPSYGTVSRRGLVAFASSLDQIGPLTGTVRDAALVAGVLAAPDPRDPTCVLEEPRDYSQSLRTSLDEVRIGVDPKAMEGVERETVEGLEAALEIFREAGARVVPLEGESLAPDWALQAYYLVACCEAASNLSRFDGLRYGLRSDGSDLAEVLAATRAEGFGPEVRRRILLGTYALREGRRERMYLRAARARRVLADRFARAFERVDVLFGPVVPEAPPPLGAAETDPLEPWRFDRLTVPASLAGLPALSMPCAPGRPAPVACQWIGPPGADADVLAVGFAAERALRRAGVETSARKEGP